jgi:hypothetical protein
MEHQKKAPKPTTHHESQKELWNDLTNHPNHANLGTPEMLPTHDEGQEEEYWNQFVQIMETWEAWKLCTHDENQENMRIVQIMEA